MNNALPAARTTPISRFGWLLADAWTIARRDLQHWRQQPGAVIVNWFFPIMIALMFGLLFGGAIAMPDGASYFEFLMPGMFAMTMFFGLEATMIAVNTDAAKGITDRFRAMPMNAAAVLLGRCVADMISSAIGLLILMVAGVLLGWRWHGPLTAALAAVGLLLLLRFAILWIGIFLGLSAKGPESVASVQILIWPVSFLSNVFVDTVTMPALLGTIAQWNPLSSTATAIRQLFVNPGWRGQAWIIDNAQLMAVVWPLILIAIFLPLSVRGYRKLGR
ncbi:MAG: ABC transporter permease [Anaerolineae bacterium]|nr:ABC transporter permease [Anaerolineae bacterium]